MKGRSHTSRRMCARTLFWFDRTTKRVALLAEFERCAGKKKDLRPKVETLLLAQQRWGCEDATLLLAYWSVGLVTLPDHDSLRAIARGGFSEDSKGAGEAK